MEVDGTPSSLACVTCRCCTVSSIRVQLSPVEAVCASRSNVSETFESAEQTTSIRNPSSKRVFKMERILPQLSAPVTEVPPNFRTIQDDDTANSCTAILLSLTYLIRCMLEVKQVYREHFDLFTNAQTKDRTEHNKYFPNKGSELRICHKLHFESHHIPVHKIITCPLSPLICKTLSLIPRYSLDSLSLPEQMR